MKHLKLFQTEAEYAAYKDSEDFVLPNVSYTVNSVKLYYTPRETRVVCKYNITDTANSTKLCTNPSNFASMEVDGILLDSATTEYTFDTVGEHIVKFELVDTTSIGVGVFDGCTDLISITIPYSITSIDNGAFANCSGLTGELIIPDSVTSIGAQAFVNCSGLTGELIIPDSVTSIDFVAFAGCSSLTSITIGNSVTSIGDGAFSGCSSLTAVTIPDSVTSIGSNTFSVCTSLNSITIGNSVTSIGNWAFQGCTNLTSIIIPDSVTSIDGSAFQNCTGLTSVIIGNSVTSIGSAFGGCSNLNEITCHATTAPQLNIYAFYNVKEDGILKVPAGSDYSSWMSTGDYYLGKYNWTIEYI